MEAIAVKTGKFFRTFAIFSLFAAVAFFSCNSEINSDVYALKKGEYNAFSRHIIGVVNNYVGSVSSNTSARTITAPDVTNSTDYDFYLYGEATESEKKFTSYIKLTIANGKFNADIEAIDWFLTVFALKAGSEAPTMATFPASSIREKSLLIGSALASFRNLNDGADLIVPFSLSTDTLTGNGYAYFSVKLSNDNGATDWGTELGRTNCTAEIQNAITGETIKYATGGLVKETLTFGSGGLTSFGGVGYNNTTHQDFGISPGTYLFIIKFVSADSGKTVGFWCDTIVIETGKTCDGVVYVPNVIDKIPEKPEKFTATYVENSEDRAGHSGYYQVHFQWEDASENERNFEIQVARCANDTIYDAAVWTPISNSRITTFDRTFSRTDSWVDGTLLANTTSATAYLMLGERYLSRIRSVNAVGESDWTYVTIPSGTTSGTGTLATDTVTGYAGGNLAYFKDETGNVAKTINRGRIMYEFNGGTYHVSSTVARNNCEPHYFTQSGLNESGNVGVSYWDAKGYNSSSTDDDLRKIEQDAYGFDVHYKFLAWSENFNNLAGSHVSSIVYKKFDNTTVYADYEVDDSGTAPAKQYKFLAKWISYSANGGAENPISTSDTAVYASISAAAGSTLNFKVEIPTAEFSKLPSTFNRYELKVLDCNGVEKTSMTTYGNPANFSTLDMTGWENGVYTAIFIAVITDGNASASYTVTLTVNLVT